MKIRNTFLGIKANLKLLEWMALNNTKVRLNDTNIRDLRINYFLNLLRLKAEICSTQSYIYILHYSAEIDYV